MSERDDNGSGLIPTDWKDHVAKTLMTLVLGGLGTLMLASGSFLLNEESRIQKLSEYTTAANESVAKYARGHEFADASLAALKRAEKRFALLYECSSKHPVNSEKMREIEMVSSQEAANDAGLLAGYTPGTTGLPAAFHENVNGFFSRELDLWRTLDEALTEMRRNPKTGRAKLFETHDRFRNLVYASSLVESSWEDTAKVMVSQAGRDSALADTILMEVHHEATMISIAWSVLGWSALVFTLIASTLFLDRLQRKFRKRATHASDR
jgi:exonuclease VII small subunit